MDLKKDIKHIIWDWNGTLVDDTEFCVNIINRVLKRRTLPEIDVEAYRDTFDFPVIDYYKRIGFDLTKHDFKVLSSEFINAYIDGRRQLKLHIMFLSSMGKKGAEKRLCMLSVALGMLS